jgi:hypothetical protein
MDNPIMFNQQPVAASMECQLLFRLNCSTRGSSFEMVRLCAEIILTGELRDDRNKTCLESPTLRNVGKSMGGRWHGSTPCVGISDYGSVGSISPHPQKMLLRKKRGCLAKRVHPCDCGDKRTVYDPAPEAPFI